MEGSVADRTPPELHMTEGGVSSPGTPLLEQDARHRCGVPRSRIGPIFLALIGVPFYTVYVLQVAQ